MQINNIFITVTLDPDKFVNIFSMVIALLESLKRF